jgi:phenylalanyl-tRNA synthetase beta chain
MSWDFELAMTVSILDESNVTGTKASEVFKIENDEVFEIGLTPNRADAMSHLGARDLRAGCKAE